ncbi:unnamed protein product, partial [Phaeothamnion confervicola]
RRDPSQKNRFVRVLITMLSSSSAAVSYEAAWTLVSLSGSPTAVRAAATTYTQLLNGQSDNNVKLIVLERLDALKRHHAKVLQEVLMDILRALSSPNVDICKKTLEVAMDLVSPRNIEEVVQVLKREVLRTQESDMDKGTAYRTLLIQAIHTCATKFADVAESVVHVLMDFLNGEGGGAMDVVLFVRSIVEQYPSLRPAVLGKLIVAVRDMASSSVLSVALWILGEYCQEAEVLSEAFRQLMDTVGPQPFDAASLLPAKVAAEAAEAAAAAAAARGPIVTTKNVVLSDGTYATQTFVQGALVPEDKAVPPLRKLIVGGDVFLGAGLAGCLTKMTLRAMEAQGPVASAVKDMQLATLGVLCGLARVVEGRTATHRGAFADCEERVAMCAKVLLDPAARAILAPTLLYQTQASFRELLERDKAAIAAQAEELIPPRLQADDLINFRQLRSQGSGAAAAADIDMYDGDDIGKATGAEDGADGAKLAHVYQLSGFADPVYAEAYVTVHDYDIVLEMLVVNRTPSTLTNLTVELATMGDLRLVERPQAHTIGPLDQRTIRANIKVSSTETGHIFGTIVYENSSTAEKTYINMNDIHLDIMDYINPATCTEEAFRAMWAEFEWENKVAINTGFTDLHEFLAHIVKETNTRCLTPMSAAALTQHGTGNFLAANLYAVSVFGEDALVNVSVERKDDADGKLSGHVRIRSKTQGIALSLGDRITVVQRGP